MFKAFRIQKSMPNGAKKRTLPLQKTLNGLTFQTQAYDLLD
jgi:hypothetical protein